VYFEGLLPHTTSGSLLVIALLSLELKIFTYPSCWAYWRQTIGKYRGGGGL